jgi:phytoene dehydrogenase-like protein
MEAARVAALRGHDVTLLEKSSHLGGLVPLAALIKGTELEDLPSLVDYLKRYALRHTEKDLLARTFLAIDSNWTNLLDIAEGLQLLQRRGVQLLQAFLAGGFAVAQRVFGHPRFE